jgi:hypothetical protein
MTKILEIEELQKAQAYLKSTESIFVISYSPKDWSYSPYANANSGLNIYSAFLPDDKTFSPCVNYPIRNHP